MDYYSIKEMAKAYGRRVDDFFAMSNDCDPFYIKNNPNKMKLVDWFKDLHDQYWELLNNRVVRSLHYLLLHHTVYLADNVTRYINLDKYYSELFDAARYARYIGVVPFGIIQEVHNPVDVYIPESLAMPKVSVRKDTPLLGLWPFPYRPKYESVLETEKAADKKEKGENQANRKDKQRCAMPLSESRTHRI